VNPTVRFYRRKLPHWEKENATHFITCILSNHIHLLLTPLPHSDETIAGVGGVPYSLAEIVHSVKSYTAKQAKKLGVVDGNLWQREYFDRWARNDGEIQRYHDYIRQNPLLAGLVKNPDDYPWQGGTPPTPAVKYDADHRGRRCSETSMVQPGGAPRLQ
jgi:REP element-mobilizing transposase RayT